MISSDWSSNIIWKIKLCSEKEMKKIVAIVVAVILSSIVLLGCLEGAFQRYPYELILDPEEIPGDWEITQQEIVNITWDRAGGSQSIFRTYESSNSTLNIEIVIYGLTDRAERTFPLHEAPAGVTPVEIEIGDEGYYWSPSSDSQNVHFIKDSILVYSWLSNQDHPELDGDWLIDLMRLQESRL
jgi:hypothetical protein